MKKPYLDMYERKILLKHPDSGTAQRLRFRMALTYFKQAVGKSIWLILKKFYRWLDV